MVTSIGSKIATGTVTTAALVTPPAVGITYRKEISKYFSGSGELESLNKRLEILGIDHCKFTEENKTSVTCSNLDHTKLSKIKFSDKASGESLNSLESDANVSLKIDKISGEGTGFPGNLKFTFTSNKDVDIGTGTKKIILKKDTNPEFKIKKEAEGDFRLERVWTAASLGRKVGLQNCAANSGTPSTKECTFKINSPFNVLLGSDRIEGAQISTANQKVEFTEDAEGYNQGFKFTVKTAINLTPTTPDKTLNTNTDYEVKLEGDKWFLVQKTNS